MSGPVLDLRKTHSAYKVGMTLTSDPDEEKRQKTYKSLLNKLTPNNFERVAKKVLEVQVPRPETLEGLINQIFDKALTETVFCELYASLCEYVEKRLPRFPDPNSERELTFKRVLLNKCQNEFESYGEEAMQAIAKQEERNKVEKEKGSLEGVVGNIGGEEGCITMSEDMNKREAEEQKVYLKNLAARNKRMQGNIQFMGHLYLKKILTECIMHECILKLLQPHGTPEPEDVECLCTLMNTIGREIDSPKNKTQMEVYFSRIKLLSENKGLESRIRFPLQNLIDLRKNGWMKRRRDLISYSQSVLPLTFSSHQHPPLVLCDDRYMSSAAPSAPSATRDVVSSQQIEYLTFVYKSSDGSCRKWQTATTYAMDLKGSIAALPDPLRKAIRQEMVNIFKSPKDADTPDMCGIECNVFIRLLVKWGDRVAYELTKRSWSLHNGHLTVWAKLIKEDTQKPPKAKK